MIKKAGRPKASNAAAKISIDWKLFDSLCNMLCTKEEICETLDISESTLSRRIREEYDLTFEALYKKKTTGGRVSLRRKQFETALAGNVPMLIWLGKQVLGQRQEPEPPGEDENAPINRLCEILDRNRKEYQIKESVKLVNEVLEPYKKDDKITISFIDD